MVLLPLEPESSASAYSAISANIKFIGQPRPRDSCGYPKFSSAWSADQISTAAPLLCSLSLPQAALTGKLPIPPYPHIKFSSSKFYTAGTTEEEPITSDKSYLQLTSTNSYYTYFAQKVNL